MGRGRGQGWSRSLSASQRQWRRTKDGQVLQVSLRKPTCDSVAGRRAGSARAPWVVHGMTEVMVKAQVSNKSVALLRRSVF